MNVVNAPAVAAARGLTVEEETRKREHGFPNTLEVSAPSEEGRRCRFRQRERCYLTVRRGYRLLMGFAGIAAGRHDSFLRNHDEPGVIGQVGNTLGRLGVNIATFALGRREATRGAEAVSLVRVDGAVPGLHREGDFKPDQGHHGSEDLPTWHKLRASENLNWRYSPSKRSIDKNFT